MKNKSNINIISWIPPIALILISIGLASYKIIESGKEYYKDFQTEKDICKNCS